MRQTDYPAPQRSNSISRVVLRPEHSFVIDPAAFEVHLCAMRPLILLSAADQVAEHLRNMILRGELGGAVPGVRTLATELGVNHKTVNSALTQLEQEGLLVTQGRGLGRKIVLPDDHTPPGLRIAILDFDAQSQGDDYMIDLRRRLEAVGHIPFFTEKSLIELGGDVARVARYTGKIRADSWIIGAGSRKILEWFSRQKTPAFALFGGWAGLPLAATGPDKATTLAEVTRRLISHGHRRISFIGRKGVRHPQPLPSICAFLHELEASGIKTGSFNLPDWEETHDGFERLLKSLFSSPTPPTALILDELFEFHATYHHLSQRGLRVPQDVSLICTDEDPGLAWCEPPVSHIRWDYRPVVSRVVRWANNVARGKEDLRQSRTQAEFIEGGTIGPMTKEVKISSPS